MPALALWAVQSCCFSHELFTVTLYPVIVNFTSTFKRLGVRTAGERGIKTHLKDPEKHKWIKQMQRLHFIGAWGSSGCSCVIGFGLKSADLKSVHFGVKLLHLRYRISERNFQHASLNGPRRSHRPGPSAFNWLSTLSCRLHFYLKPQLRKSFRFN